MARPKFRHFSRSFHPSRCQPTLLWRSLFSRRYGMNFSGALVVFAVHADGAGRHGGGKRDDFGALQFTNGRCLDCRFRADDFLFVVGTVLHSRHPRWRTKKLECGCKPLSAWKNGRNRQHSGKIDSSLFKRLTLPLTGFHQVQYCTDDRQVGQFHGQVVQCGVGGGGGSRTFPAWLRQVLFAGGAFR